MSFHGIGKSWPWRRGFNLFPGSFWASDYSTKLDFHSICDLIMALFFTNSTLSYGDKCYRMICVCLYSHLHVLLQVNSGIDLVYGGGSIGLMGLVSHAVHDGGRHVLGVIPKSLMLKELTGGPVGEVREVSDMHERKAEMARQADAFIALPGGYGTLEELLEVITWAQLGIHKKPVGLLNVDGFYNSLLSFIDMAVEEGFISQAARHIIISAHSAKELMRKLEEYIPEYESKLVWDTTEQKSALCRNRSSALLRNFSG